MIYIMHICIRNKKNSIMTPRFYILKEEVKHFVTPEPEELKEAESQMKWGMKKGIISLVNEIRTSTTYWEV